MLGARLLTLEALAFLLQTALSGFLLSPVVSSGRGHGILLPFVVSRVSSRGGDHDPFFLGFQALSCVIDGAAASGADPTMLHTSQISSLLSSNDLQWLGLDPQMRLRRLDRQHLPYLAFHRHLFENRMKAPSFALHQGESDPD
jgi:hypothetical protein